MYIGDGSLQTLYGMVGFNVPLDTLQVTWGTILRVRRPNQQCNSRQCYVPWVRWSADNITEVQTQRAVTEWILLRRRRRVSILNLTSPAAMDYQ